MAGNCVLKGPNLEKYGKFWKNDGFSGRIWPEWGNTTWADMAGLGSIGLNPTQVHSPVWDIVTRALKMLWDIATTQMVTSKEICCYFFPLWHMVY